MFQIKSAFNTGTEMKIGTNRLNSAGASFSNFKQSPKVVSGKFREQKKPFSLIDVPIGKNNNGTSLPVQFMRKDEAELEKLFNMTTKNADFSKFKLLENKQNEESKYNQNEQRDKSQLEEKNNKFSDKINNFNERNIHTADNKSFRSKKFISDDETKDRWMPAQFKDYERQLKTAHSSRQNNLPSIRVKEIKEKMLESDIFFIKKSDDILENFDKVREISNKSKGIDYLDSDVFNLKNNINRGYLKEDKIKQHSYNITSISNSQWHPKVSNGSFLNHSSTDYHILNPGIKHITKTKEKIKQECTNFNPIYRQKSLCEFIDLTRVGVPNPNKEFISAFNKSNKAFFRESNICAGYLDMYKSYKNLSDKPFAKKFI